MKFRGIVSTITPKPVSFLILSLLVAADDRERSSEKSKTKLQLKKRTSNEEEANKVFNKNKVSVLPSIFI